MLQKPSNLCFLDTSSWSISSRFACTPAFRRPWWTHVAVPSMHSPYLLEQNTATTRKTPTGVSTQNPPSLHVLQPPAARDSPPQHHPQSAQPCPHRAPSQPHSVLGTGRSALAHLRPNTTEPKTASLVQIDLFLTVVLIACHLCTPQKCQVEDLTR